MKIYAVGSDLFTTIFRTAGCETYSIDSPSALISAVKKAALASDGAGLILIQKDLINNQFKDILKLRVKTQMPIIYAIETPFNSDNIKENYEKELLKVLMEAQSI